jgi:hypothetical protein
VDVWCGLECRVVGLWVDVMSRAQAVALESKTKFIRGLGLKELLLAKSVNSLEQKSLLKLR